MFKIHARSAGLFSGLGVVALVSMAALTFSPPAATAGQKSGKASNSWKSIAKKLRSAAKLEAKADYLIELARAALVTDKDDREEAIDDAKDEFKEERELAGEQYEARLDLAERLGEATPYSVTIDKNQFGTVIDNPLMPLTPGTTRTYEADTEDGKETIVVSVLHETRTILGVTCTVVRDTVSVDGELVEDTYDWFAQDLAGNVWYFGEIAVNYEDGQISDVDGSWEAGKDGARPGIVMRAEPALGDLYRQEFLLAEAEDYAEVLALGVSESVPFGDFANCLKTFDGSALEPDALEHKFYAPGVGVVLELDVESGVRVELISVTVE